MGIIGHCPVLHRTRTRDALITIARNLDRADHAAQIVRVDPLCCNGVTMREEAMYAAAAAACGNARHGMTKARMLLRHVEVISLDECLDIEPRPADDERQAPCRIKVTCELRHARDKLRHGERRIGIEHIDKMMRHTSALLRTRLRTANVKAAIDEHRVPRDDLRAEPFRELQ